MIHCEISLVLTISMGVPTGIGISSMVFFCCSPILGHNAIHLAIHVVLLLSVSGFLWRIRRTGKEPRRIQVVRSELYAMAGYAIMSLYLCFKFYFPSPRSLCLALDSHVVEEISLQSSFYVGVNSGFINPLRIWHPNYAGRRVVTRWLLAFHASMMRIGYATLRSSLAIPSAMLITSFCVILQQLAILFEIPVFIAWMVPLVSLFVSGFGFLRVLVKERRTVRTNDYVSQSGYGKITRFHPVIHLLLGFRHTTLALPITAMMLYALYAYVRRKSHAQKSMLPMTGLLVGAVLPGVEHQAFCGAVVFFFAFSLLQVIQKRKLSRQLKLFGVLLLTGFLFHLPRYLDTTFLHDLFGIETPWGTLVRLGEFVPVFSVWWHNCGLFIVVVLFFSWFKLLAIEYNLYMFILTLYRFVLSPKEPEVKGVMAAICLIAVMACTASCVLGIHKQVNNVKAVWGTTEEQLVGWILKNTPTDSVFMAPLVALNPISLLAGRPMFLECSDVMRHIGYNSTTREQEYREFLSSNGTTRLDDMVQYFVTADDGWSLPLDKWRKVYYYREFNVYQRR